MVTREAVYAKFGLAAEAAQLLETELGSILLVLEGEKRRWRVSPNPDEAAVFYEKLDKKTLGQILSAVKSHTKLADHLEAEFERGLLARNRLNHGFFHRHNFAMFAAEGRGAMIAELDELHQELLRAYYVAQRISSAMIGRLLPAQACHQTKRLARGQHSPLRRPRRV